MATTQQPLNDPAIERGLSALGLSEEREIAPSNSNFIMRDADSGFTTDGSMRNGFRLLGIDAPETAHASNQYTAEPLAYAAQDELERQVEMSGGATVESSGALNADARRRNYGRDLAVMRGADDRNINAELARTGLVNSPRYQPEQEYRDALRGANWRTSTDAGSILTGDAAEVNQRVKALQQEVFQARERGELGAFIKPDTDPNTRHSAWDKAFTRGVHNTAAMYDGFVAAIGDLGKTANPGEDTLANSAYSAIKSWGEEGMAQRLQKAAAFPAEIEAWDDVQSLDNFGTFVVERFGEQLPQLGLDAAMFLGTGGAATAMRIGLAKSMARELPAGTLPALFKDAGRVGAVSGIYGQSTGETAIGLQQEGVDEYGGTALLTGIPKAALEYAPLEFAFKNALAATKLSGNQLSKVASRLATAAGVEGTTEGLQTTLDFIAKQQHTGEEIFSDENIRELKTAVAAGAVVGTGMQGVASIPPIYQSLRDNVVSPAARTLADKWRNRAATAPAEAVAATEGVNLSTPAVLDEITDDYLGAVNPHPIPETPVVTDPEPTGDIDAQVRTFWEGDKPAVYVSRANAEAFESVRGAAGEDATVLETPEGLLVTRKPIDSKAYLSAQPSERERMRQDHLGYLQSKDEIDPTQAVTVQTRDAEGNIIQQEATDIPDIAVANQQRNAPPGTTVEVVSMIDAMAEREARVNAERTDDAAGAAVLPDEQPVPDAAMADAGAQPTGVDSGIPGAVPTVEQAGPVAGAGIEPTGVPADDADGWLAAGLEALGAGRVAPVQPVSESASAGRGAGAAIPTDRAGEQLLASTPTVSGDQPRRGGRVSERNDLDISEEEEATYREVLRKLRTQTAPVAGIDWSNVDLITLPTLAQTSLTQSDLAALKEPEVSQAVSILKGRGLSAINALGYVQASRRAQDVSESGTAAVETMDESLVEDSEGRAVPGVAAADLDASPIVRTGDNLYFGKLQQLHIKAFEAAYPTWEMRPVGTRSGDQGKGRSHLGVARRVFPDRAKAQEYASHLETLYVGETFNVVPVTAYDARTGSQAPTGEFHLTRHAVASALGTGVDPIVSWAHKSVPKILLNASGADTARTAARKRMVDEKASPAAQLKARDEYLVQDAQLIRMRQVDVNTGRVLREVDMHAPTITEFGRELTREMTEAGQLERDFAAFSSGIAALWQSGYQYIGDTYVVKGGARKPLLARDIAFTPSKEKMTIWDVQEQRTAVTKSSKLIDKLERQLARLSSIQNNMSSAEFADYMAKNKERGNPLDMLRKELDAQVTYYTGATRRSTADGFNGEFLDFGDPDAVKFEDVVTADELSPYEIAKNERDAATEWDLHHKTFDQRGMAPARSMSEGMVKVETTKFLNEFPGAKDMRVEYSTSPANYRTGVRKATYYPAADRLVVYTNNFTDAADLRRTLQHEIFTHKGLGFLTPAQTTAMLGEIRGAIKSDPKVAAIYEDLTGADGLYKNVPEAVQLEETLAFVAEGLRTGVIPRTWNRILVAVRSILRQLGLIGANTGLPEMERVLHDISASFARGRRAANRGNGVGSYAHSVVPKDIMRMGVGAVKSVGEGLRKLGMPMASGLYQLNEISQSAATGFRRYWTVRDRQRAFWEGEFQNRVKMTTDEVNAAWRELVDRGETDDLQGISANARTLRTFLDSFYEQFAKPNMPTLGRIPNYVPQMMDIRQLVERKEEFITVLVNSSAQVQGRPLSRARADAIYTRLVANNGSYDMALEDYNGVVAPGNDHRHARFLRSPELIAALDDANFIYGDKREVIDHYLTVSVNRGAFENVFGGMRTVEGWQNPNGSFNYQLLQDLLSSAGRFDLIEQHKDPQALLDAAIAQGYAAREPGRVIPNMSMSQYMKASTGLEIYDLLSTLARKQGYKQYVKPLSLINDLGGYKDYLQSVGVTVPAYLKDQRIPEKLQWYAPTQSLYVDREQVAPEQRSRFDEIIHGFMGYFGARVSPQVHRWQSNIMAYESVLTLAFSTLSSLPDFAGPFLRVMRDQGVAQALNQLRIAMGNVVSGNFAATRTAARDFGFMNHRQTQAALKAMWGQEHYSPTAQKVLEGLFKYNGQEFLTQQSRAFSVGVGLEYFKTMAAARNDAVLATYGLQADLVNRWFQTGQQPYTLELKIRGGQEAGDAEIMHNALHKFVDESIVRPNAGQRPVWASDPRFALLWHLKSFLWAYWSVIVSPVGRSIIEQVGKGKYGEAGMQMAFTGLALLPLAALGWELRQLIQYSMFDEEQPDEQMDGFQYAGELIKRSGLGGPFQLALDATGQNSLDEGLIRIGGPTLGHAWVLLNGDWDEKVYRSTPLLGQLYGAQAAISGR